ncbi:EpsG family protein [Sphingomonas sp. DC1100-1]|uniref:EpsG family protein n=1 Tax=unclassified Sphingomonas TaxID=196159 RepID=UPI003CF7C529
MMPSGNPPPAAASDLPAANDLPRRLALIGIIIVGSLVAGLKLVGPAPDYRNYEAQYLIDSVSPFTFIWQASDPLYHSLARIFALLGARFELFVALIAICTCAFKATALSRTNGNRLVLLLLYSSYLFWLHDYVQIRIALALAFGLFGIYTETRLRYLFLLIATLIHSSFILIVVAYILIFVGTKRPVLAAVAGLTFAALLLTQDVFSQILQRVNEYQDLTTQGRFNEINIFSLMPIVMFASLVVAIFDFRSLNSQYQELVLAIVGLISFYALSNTPVFAFRMMELFMPFYLVLISRLWDKNNVIKILALAYVVIGLRAIFFSIDPLIGGNFTA